MPAGWRRAGGGVFKLFRVRHELGLLASLSADPAEIDRDPPRAAAAVTPPAGLDQLRPG